MKMTPPATNAAHANVSRILPAGCASHRADPRVVTVSLTPAPPVHSGYRAFRRRFHECRRSVHSIRTRSRFRIPAGPAAHPTLMVKTQDLVRAWGGLLRGRKPALSIEITKECPLRCPGCYAFADQHVAPGVNLKQLSDLRGDALIEGVTDLVRRRRPLHVSLVGGDPLVRYRELEILVPRLLAMGVFLQIVTSAFRPLPAAWAGKENLELVVSIDGLGPDHDRRRAPATYDRIRKHISGQRVVVHCTVTAQMARQAGYLEEFVKDWSANPNVKK